MGIRIIRDHSNSIEIVLPDWDRAETKSLKIRYRVSTLAFPGHIIKQAIDPSLVLYLSY